MKWHIWLVALLLVAAAGLKGGDYLVKDKLEALAAEGASAETISREAIPALYLNLAFYVVLGLAGAFGLLYMLTVIRARRRVGN